MRPTLLHPVSPDLPLLTASALAAPATLCGIWLASAPALQPMPVRLFDTGAWRTLLIGSDLGRLLTAVDSALVDAGAGPVLISAASLRHARRLSPGFPSRVRYRLTSLPDCP